MLLLNLILIVCFIGAIYNTCKMYKQKRKEDAQVELLISIMTGGILLLFNLV